MPEPVAALAAVVVESTGGNHGNRFKEGVLHYWVILHLPLELIS